MSTSLELAIKIAKLVTGAIGDVPEAAWSTVPDEWQSRFFDIAGAAGKLRKDIAEAEVANEQP